MAGHRYWRLLLHDSGGGAYAMAEVQFRTTAGTPLLFSGGTATAAQAYLGTPGPYDATKVSDGDPSTFWSSNDKNGTQYWEYDYGASAAPDIVELTIQARPDAYYNQAPTAFDVQCSDDGQTWKARQSCANVAWGSAGQLQTFAVPALTQINAATTWNPADTISSIVLSSGNLTATCQAGASWNNARATVFQTTGKVYFEATFWGQSYNNATVAVGLAPARFPLDRPIAFDSGAVAVEGGAGTLIVNAQSTGVALGQVGQHGVVGLAVNFDTLRIWCRLNNGPWNNDATQDPAAGTGGVDISPVAGLLFPIVTLNGGGFVCQANFGASSFAGAAPSGYFASPLAASRSGFAAIMA